MSRLVAVRTHIDDLDGEAAMGTQFRLLAALVVDEQLDDAELDRFLAEACTLADQ